MNIAIAAPTLCSMQITKPFSSFAKKSRVATAREKTLGSARPKLAPVEVECVPTGPGFRVPGRNVPTDWRKTGRAGGLRPGDTANACRPRAIAQDVAG